VSYPEGLWPEDYCYMEGHKFRDGGACVRCGEQLRCHFCGRYMTLSPESVREHAHMPCSPDCEGCDLCMAPVGAPTEGGDA
jgi:hypothetical protein